MSEKVTYKPTISSPVKKERFFSVFDTKANANRFWNITLYVDGTVVTHFGRQGYDGTYTIHSPSESRAGESGFLSQINSKICASHKPSPYIENEVIDAKGQDSRDSNSPRRVSNISVARVAQEQIVAGCQVAKDLIKYLINVNAHDIMEATHGGITYDASTAQFRTTQGVISQSQVMEARNLLTTLGKMVSQRNWDSTQFEDNMNRYLSLVPQKWGMKRLEPRGFLPDGPSVGKQNDLLDGLDASFNEVVTAAQTDKGVSPAAAAIAKVFNVKLDRITDAATRKIIEKLYIESQNRMHTTYGWKIRDIYAVDIEDVHQSFEKHGKAFGNIMRLWHGTKASNLLSILKKGLIIPPYDSRWCAGRLYGNGVYASDQSSKASQYAVGIAPGQSRASERRYFMFVVDFAMGKMYKPGSGGYGDNYPVRGYDSTFAEGGRASVRNNEFIVYKTYQVNLVYLVEFAG
jgi:poly [ADP-ribose] polymerase